MADENKNTSLKYRYNGTDLDNDVLLKNLDHNVQNYIKYKGWDESKTREFADAYNKYRQAITEGRLSQDAFGTITDSAGHLNNGRSDWRDKNGNVISQEQYDVLKKKDKKKATNDFYANREVATYINTIAKGVADKLNAKEPEAPAESPKFKFGENDFWTSFMRSLNPSGTPDVNVFVDKDEYNKENKSRGITNRAKMLSDYLTTQYKDNFDKDSKLDYSGTSVESREDYIKRLDALSNALSAENPNLEDIRVALEGVGAKSTDYNPYFYTGQGHVTADTDTSGASTSEEDEEPEKTEEEKAREEDLANLQQRIQNEEASNHYLPIFRLKYGQRDIKADNFMEWLTDLNGKNLLGDTINATGGEVFGKTKNDRGYAYGDILNRYAVYAADDDELKNSVADATSVNYQGWKYLPGSYNDNDFTVLAFDPNGRVGRKHLYDIAPDALEEYELSMAQKRRDEQARRKNLGLNKKEGGVLFSQSGGSVIERGRAANQRFLDMYEASSKETKSNPMLRRLRKPASDFSDNALSVADFVRLGAIAADIYAVASPDPFTSGIAGVASDFANFGADIHDKQGVWSSLGTLGANLGLTAMSAIPIFGQAVGSTAKVVKTLSKITPKITKGLVAAGALYTLSNGQDIINSFSKIGKSGPENELNMQDWRNIATGIQFLLGTKNALKTHKATGKVAEAYAKEAKTSKGVYVRTKDAAGETKILKFVDPDEAKAIRAAGNDVNKINDIIQSHDSYKKYTVDTTTSTVHDPNEPWYKLWKKTTSTSLKNGAVSDAVNIDNIRNQYKEKTRERRIVDRSFKTPEAEEVAAISKASAQPAQPAPTTAQSVQWLLPAPINGKQLDFSGMREGEIIRRMRRKQNDTLPYGVTNTPEYLYLRDQLGYDPNGQVLQKKHKQGGRIRAARIVKAQEGWKFGNYQSTIDDYSGFEYQSPTAVSLSAIGNANASLRSSNLSTKHKDPNYDYEDAQGNTNRARQSIWGDATTSNAIRTSDIANFMKNYFDSQKKDINNLSVDDLDNAIGAYNRAIDSMYRYKHKAGKLKGDESYFSSNDVINFNRTHHGVYATANDENHLGYEPTQESYNGTTTAERPIDITDQDVTLDFSNLEGFDEGLKNILNSAQFVKDTTGRVKYREKTPEVPAQTPVEGTADTTAAGVTPGTDTTVAKNPNPSADTKSPFNWGGIVDNLLPNAFSAARYIATRVHNKNQYDLAKQAPVLLYQPMQKLKWVEGNLGAEQEGYRAAGQLGHIAATPITANGEQQTAAMLEANSLGSDKINTGKKTNWEAAAASNLANWNQEYNNLVSRYQTATKNRENLFNHRMGLLQAKGNYLRSNYESLNNLLGEYQQKAQAAHDKNDAYRLSAATASLTNVITADLKKYGISSNPDDQEFINGIMNGTKTYESLSDAEKTRYTQLKTQIDEAVQQRILAAQGISYTPYPYGSVSFGSYNPSITAEAAGGTIPEKVAIQQLRGRIAKMQIFQKHLEARMNAFEKDMDRSYKSASEYVKSQKKAK